MSKFLLFFISFSVFANYDEVDFKKDLASPYKHETGQSIFLWGSLLTSSLILTRPTWDKVQEDIHRRDDLKDLSPVGDYSAQLIPNAIYTLYQYYQGSKKRSVLMLKASLFAGGTTFFLKRLFNEKRPNSGDRLSFPSGHSTTAFAFAGVIAREHKGFAIPAYALATLVGYSRMNDNAHYLHDVTMGATIGLAYAYSIDRETNIYPIVGHQLFGLRYLNYF